MYIASLTRARDAIRIAEGRLGGKKADGSAVADLLGGTAEVIGPHLGTTVSLLPPLAAVFCSYTRSSATPFRIPSKSPET